ncbi:MAG: lysophospholipid acyltransferase family protein [Cyanobacteria bacterium P01_A01_bin.137]
MLFNPSLHISHGLLKTVGTEVVVRHRERVPHGGAMLVISNHRSFLDAPLVMTAVNRSVRFACHHYMSQVPVLKDMIAAMGCFPLDAPGQRHQTFFQTAIRSLKAREPIGIFPEGAQPMVQATRPDQVGRFHRGFAHLALRAPVRDLTILPVAISSMEETISPVAPLRLLSLFDPSEPLFNRPGWHPSVHYRRVTLSVGKPIPITPDHRSQYHGRQAGRLAKELTQSCYGEISKLLEEGFT